MTGLDGTMWMNGFSIAETAGFEVRLTDNWSIGLEATFVNPIWIKQCFDSDEKFCTDRRLLFDEGKPPWIIDLSATVTAVFL